MSLIWIALVVRLPNVFSLTISSRSLSFIVINCCVFILGLINYFIYHIVSKAYTPIHLREYFSSGRIRTMCIGSDWYGL